MERIVEKGCAMSGTKKIHKNLKAATKNLKFLEIKMENSKIKAIIKNKDWDALLDSFSLEDIAEHISLKEGVILFLELVDWDYRSKFKHPEDVAELLFAIRKKHIKEWNSDWRYDVFLGNTCRDVGRSIEDAFEAYFRAYHMLKNTLQTHLQ